jgi:sugar (pentulose or hexulose) kinase
MHVYIGLDLGTSSVKAVALDNVGSLLAQSSATYPTRSPHPGWAEQDPADWSRAATAALSDLTSALPTGAIPTALGLAGQLPTLALLDEAGAALRPAVVWYDGRASEQAADMLRTVGPEEWYRRSGVVFDAHYLAPMHAWITTHEPGALRQVYKVCGAKDALLHALTGVWTTDPSTASGSGVYAARKCDWDDALLSAAGLTRSQLPDLLPSWSIAGPLREGWDDSGLPAGLPVVVGGADSLAGVLGSGGAEPGTMVAISGTSTAMLATATAPLLDSQRRFFLTPHVLPELWGLEMDLLSTGSAIRWLAEQLGLADPGTLAALAVRSPLGSHGVVALPYLAGGEQGALWDEQARGALAGLALAHGPADLARALLEGIAFEMRRCLLAWEDAGVHVDHVVLAASDQTFFARMLADVLDRPVRLFDGPSSSALGAALLAGIGVGTWGVAEARAIAGRERDAALLPDPTASRRYAALYERYHAVSLAFRQYSVEVR